MDFLLVGSANYLLNQRPLFHPRLILITGVAGSGKSTLGRQVAAALHWTYYEGDDFHSPANQAKMAGGIPLDDADRAPWLASIRAQMDACRVAGEPAVFTCSALKESYRRILLDGTGGILLVYLTGDFATIHARVASRSAHFMKADLVQSQFAVLEPPAGALTLDIANPPAELLARVLAEVRAGEGSNSR